MWRLWIGLIVVGGMMLVFGFKQAKVSSGATRTPQEVSLAELEQGGAPDNNHVVIGEHWCLYPESIFEYVSITGRVSDSATVHYTYYPIISPEHAFMQEVGKLAEKYEDLEKVPDGEWPDVKDFAVLVKTRAFGTVGAIPDEWMPCKSVQGMFINRVTSLDADDRRLLRGNFPQMDLDKVLILEAGRMPNSPVFSYGLMLAGVVVAGAGVGAPLYIRKKRRESEARSEARRQARLGQAREAVRAAEATPPPADGVAAPAAEPPPAPPPLPRRGPDLPGEDRPGEG